MKKLINVNPGDIYAIPLFVSDQPELKSFARVKFDSSAGDFGFCRIIEDRGGSGIIVEVFKCTGDPSAAPSMIVDSGRLFPPIAISGVGIFKKRWRFRHSNEAFDKEKDAKYSEITLVLGPDNDLRLWQNGVETPISKEDSRHYELWEIWPAFQVEKRILAARNSN